MPFREVADAIQHLVGRRSVSASAYGLTIESTRPPTRLASIQTSCVPMLLPSECVHAERFSTPAIWASTHPLPFFLNLRSISEPDGTSIL